MKAVIAEFEQRVKDIERYFKLLGKLEDPSLLLVHSDHPNPRGTKLDAECFKMLKATAFLLLYNLIESAIRSAFGKMYETIKLDGKQVPELRKELRSLWVDQRYRSMDSYSASPLNYHKAAEALVTQIIDKAVAALDPQWLPVSGNLDAERVRQVCEKHGVPSKAHFRAKGGSDLAIVKEQRNALAHGEVSFCECGRQFTVDDLHNIKCQTVVFVRSILRNLSNYVHNKRYCA